MPFKSKDRATNAYDMSGSNNDSSTGNRSLMIESGTSSHMPPNIENFQEARSCKASILPCDDAVKM